MLVLNEFIADAILTAYHSQSGTAAWPFFLSGWLDAACCGAVLAALLRAHGVRSALLASLTLLAAIAIPILFGFSSKLTAATWLLLVGAVPAMTLGAAVFVVLRRR
jgi:hypothetical protein